MFNEITPTQKNPSPTHCSRHTRAQLAHSHTPTKFSIFLSGILSYPFCQKNQLLKCQLLSWPFVFYPIAILAHTPNMCSFRKSSLCFSLEAPIDFLIVLLISLNGSNSRLVGNCDKTTCPILRNRLPLV